MTGPDTANPSGGSDGDSRNGVDSSNGGVTTVAPSQSYPAATPFADDVAHSPYGSPSTYSEDSSGSSVRTDKPASNWSGSPYEPLPSDPPTDYASPSTDTYGTATPVYGDPGPTYIAPAADQRPAPAPVSGKQTKSRAIAGLVGAALGTLLIVGGLYLVGEFGFRIYDVMLNIGGRPSPWDIVWTSVGAAMIFAAVLLNGWSPWATLPAGLALTAVGVWSIAWYDGADRVATAIDRLYARPEMVVWGITGWLLVIGLLLVGASGAAIIARAAGRRRGLPTR